MKRIDNNKCSTLSEICDNEEDLLEPTRDKSRQNKKEITLGSKKNKKVV